jgi:uncharacterized protein (TIGR03083 family)
VIEGTVIQASTIPRIKHDEAMAITEVENHRLGEVLADVTAEQWTLPTDCTRWDVRAIAVHLIASAEAQASPGEMIKLMRAGPKLMTEIEGIYPVDGINEAALRARTHLAPIELPALWRTVAAKALRARQRIPAPIRALPLLKLAPRMWKPVGYLYDIGFTRDVWMHRVDLSRAIDRNFQATTDHDGRIVADILAEWATTHTDPFCLKLTGPAGGTYVRDAFDEVAGIEMDAIDCCRILSGRGEPVGVLHHPLLL